MTRPDSSDTDWIDEVLKSFYNRIVGTAGQSFAGDPYTILSKSAKAQIAAKLREASRNGFYYGYRQGLENKPPIFAHTELEKFISQLKAPQGGKE